LRRSLLHLIDHVNMPEISWCRASSSITRHRSYLVASGHKQYPRRTHKNRGRKEITISIGAQRRGKNSRLQNRTTTLDAISEGNFHLPLSSLVRNTKKKCISAKEDSKVRVSEAEITRDKSNTCLQSVNLTKPSNTTKLQNKRSFRSGLSACHLTFAIQCTLSHALSLTNAPWK
jgi:hypothetical protein